MQKHTLATALALSFPLMAGAQTGTNVTLYGNVSTGIEYVNNIGNQGAVHANGGRLGGDGSLGKNSSIHFNNITQTIASRWGLRGSEDLGDGLSAVFTIESGFNAPTGTSGQGGRLMGRQAFVGLKGDWGQLAFGRQYNMLAAGLARADFMGPNMYGLGVLDVYIPNTRMDNAITYTGSFNGVRLGAAWARGRDTQGPASSAATGCGVNFQESSACRAYSMVLGYDTDDFGVAGAWDVITGAAGGDWYGLSKDDDDRRFTLNGWAKFGDFKAGLIYLNRKSDAGINGILITRWADAEDMGKRSDFWSLSLAYQLSPQVLLDGQINYIKFKDARDLAGTRVSSNAWHYVLRSQYFISKRTAFYAQAAHIRNKGLSALAVTSGTGGFNGLSPKLGGSQSGMGIGMNHFF